ncbi:MAG TPA: VWA domain-containing protein [Candidatus Sulfotelmatobacter sp.]|jgi:Ca-activated chloride channel family protein|nr:VWA domain-containing protein [Candidatus Sulfotelmatobacter sp.]
MYAARAVASLLFSFFMLASAFAQTASLDQPHITPLEKAPRGKTADIASAEYASPFTGGGLIHARSDLVLVPVSITDDLNRAVVGLNRENFQLFENKKPQQIRNFSSEDTPVSIGIIVDTSGSMSSKLDRAREAVRRFCDVANPQDEFFLITFSDAPHLVTDFTQRPENIEGDLITTQPKGKTALLDAIYMGIQKLHNAKYKRKALLVLSDGGDNHSRYNERQIRNAVRESDVTIYAVGTYERYVTTQEELLGPELLSTLTRETGGQAFVLSNVNEMPQVTQAIGTQLRHQYVLAYTPQSASRDGRWHKISVKLRLPKKFLFLHVDARAGYYADQD